jgi:hypothetical protein
MCRWAVRQQPLCSSRKPPAVNAQSKPCVRKRCSVAERSRRQSSARPCAHHSYAVGHNPVKALENRPVQRCQLCKRAQEKSAEQAAETVLKEPARVETLAVSSSDPRCGRAAPRAPPAAALADETWGLAQRRRVPSRRPAVWAGRARAPPLWAPREVVALKPGRNARRIACYRSTSSFPSLG